MTVDTGTTARRRRARAGRRRRPGPDPVRPGPRGRPPRRRGDRPLRAAVPGPGTQGRAAHRAHVALLFLLTGLVATAFVVAYIWWPWEYEPGDAPDKFYTPLLGLTLGLALFVIGVRRSSTWGKKLLPEEVSVQDRHDGASPQRRAAGSPARRCCTWSTRLGIKRRPLLKAALAAAGLAPLGAGRGGAADRRPDQGPARRGHPVHTPAGTRRAQRRQAGPADPRGRHADPARGRQRRRPDHGVPGHPGRRHQQVRRLADAADPPARGGRRGGPGQQRARRRQADIDASGFMYGNFVAYSKICTHAGCPASLYEQQTNRLLCPCHQSQFLITDNARPIFGPASRRLPHAAARASTRRASSWRSRTTRSPVGPAFWERP